VQIYNLGFINSINLGASGLNHCYALDITNRLIGWFIRPSGCNILIIGNLNSLS
jgi:hypothetical protein